MGATRRDLYEPDVVFLTDQLKAVAHPARLIILKLIQSNKADNCRDLSKTIGLYQATIAQHLVVLKSRNLIFGKVIKNEVRYSINYDALINLNNIMNINIISLIAA